MKNTLKYLAIASIIPCSFAYAENPTNKLPGPYEINTSEQLENQRLGTSSAKQDNSDVRKKERRATGNVHTPNGVYVDKDKSDKRKYDN